jgi:hypothetical protein
MEAYRLTRVVLRFLALAILIALVLVGYRTLSNHIALARLYADLHSHQPARRASAITRLASPIDWPAPDVEPALAALAADPDIAVRQAAASSLGHTPLVRYVHPEAMGFRIYAALLTAAREDPSPCVRAAALSAASNCVDEFRSGRTGEFRRRIAAASERVVREALNDHDSAVRDEARRLLESLEDLGAQANVRFQREWAEGHAVLLKPLQDRDSSLEGLTIWM